MFFFRKAHNALLRARSTEADLLRTQSFWSQVVRQFQRNKRALWALRTIALLLAIALFADVLANDKPLLCSLNGIVYFPVFRSFFVEWGIANWQPALALADWQIGRAHV